MASPPAEQAASVGDGDGDGIAQHPQAESTADAEELIIICGETRDGGKFRPSDWSDRLRGALRVLGDEAEDVGEYVHLINYRGQKCLMLDTELKEQNAQVFAFFMRFAADNKLSTESMSRRHWQSLHA